MGVVCACGQPVDTAAPTTQAPASGPFDDLPVVDATLVEPGPKACASPADGPPLTAITDPAVLPEEDPAAWATEAPIVAAEGIAVADFNGDGVLDVYRPTRVLDHLYVGRLDEGSFRLERLDPSVWLPDDAAIAFGQGGVAADVDDDGDLDLFVMRWDKPDALWLNDGAGAFRSSGDVQETLGTDLRATLGAGWGDTDGDGDLDLLVLATGAGPTGPPPWAGAADFEPADPNALLLNDGAGGFLEAPLPGLDDEPYSCCAAWVDLDADHDRDLVIVNDFGPQVAPNLTFYQDDGVLVRRDTEGLNVAAFGMGLALGDLNDDLSPDFVTADWDRVWMSLSHADGGWYDAARALGVVPGHPDSVVAWGNELQDIDNDGDLDLWQAYGYFDVPHGFQDAFDAAGLPNPRQQPDALLLQQEDGSFVEAAAEWGLDDPGSTRGGVWADLNRDGVLDLVAARQDGPLRLHLSQCTDAGWLTVRLEQPAPNRNAIGARVLVEDGDWRALRYLQAGGVVLASSGPAELHVGLGDRERVERLTVLWPDGTRSVFEDVAANQHLTVTRAE